MKKQMQTMMNKREEAGKNALMSGHFLMAWYDWEMRKKTDYEKRFDRLEKKIDYMISLISPNNETFPENVIVVREMSYDEAKKQVLNYFNKHEEADIAELHQELGIEIDKLIQIIDDLRDEKIIG